MPQIKNTHSKQMKNKKVVTSTTQDAEDMVDPVLEKNKKTIELDVAEEVLPTMEEKLEEETSISDDSEDSSADELTLDDDELNPFGDKWEQ